MESSTGKKRVRPSLVPVRSNQPVGAAGDGCTMEGETYVDERNKRRRSCSVPQSLFPTMQAKNDCAGTTLPESAKKGGPEGATPVIHEKFTKSETKTKATEQPSRSSISKKASEYVEVEFSDEDFVDFGKKIRVKIQLK